METQLSVNDLRVRFPTSRGVVEAVNGVTFTLEKGSMLGIVGESGSGKSVTAKALMNLLPRTAEIDGKVRFDGEDVRAMAAAGSKHFWGVKMTMVFQDPMTSLNPVKKCGEQIAETLRYHLGYDKRAAMNAAADLLEQVGIPDLLIADEPTTAVDVTVQKRILDLLDSLRKERGMSMILITHDLGVARGRCDDVAVMYAGRIVERAATETMFDQSRHPYTEALLRSIPRIDQPSHARLDPIPGRPPELIAPPVQCAFAPRCRYAQPDCLESVPKTEGLGESHEFACHHPANTPSGRDALAANVAAGVTATGLKIGYGARR